MDRKLLNKLYKRKEEGTIRSLSHFEGFIDFCSNDYLGFANTAINTTGESLGSTGSRLISGNSQMMLAAEKTISTFFNAEAGLMFNSGYDANVGFFSSIPQRGDTVIYDELIHASVRDGMRLSFAKCYPFKHNNLDDLETQIVKANGTVYVAVEGLYSMDGDLSPLRGLATLCEKYGAYLVVDEAHSAGVYGKDGKGFVAALELERKVFARLITFGKAYGSHGGCILGSKDLIDYLTNFARSFIYTTALPESTFNRNVGVIIDSTLNERRKELQNLLTYFRENYNHVGLISERNSPIQIIEIGGIDLTKTVALKLQEDNIAVKAIYAPTVKAGHERLRICIHAFNTKNEIDRLIRALPT